MVEADLGLRFPGALSTRKKQSECEFNYSLPSNDEV
jgi:hypothetical protein